MSSDAHDSLTRKQKAFADAYALHGNAQRAAMDAGYSKKSAAVIAYENLRKPQIVEYLSRVHVKPEQQRNEELRERVLRELEAMAFTNVADFTREEDGHLVPDFSTATREQLSSVTKVKHRTRKIYNGKGDHVATEVDSDFALADKYRGLELLGRQLGLFKDAETRVVVDIADRLLEGRKRLLALPAPNTEDD